MKSVEGGSIVLNLDKIVTLQIMLYQKMFFLQFHSVVNTALLVNIGFLKLRHKNEDRLRLKSQYLVLPHDTSQDNIKNEVPWEAAKPIFPSRFVMAQKRSIINHHKPNAWCLPGTNVLKCIQILKVLSSYTSHNLISFPFWQTIETKASI